MNYIGEAEKNSKILVDATESGNSKIGKIMSVPVKCNSNICTIA